MLRPQMRDEIRVLAEIMGADTMAGLLNITIQQILNSTTSLNRYPECYLINQVLTPIANGIVPLPAVLQHLDMDEIYFQPLGDGDDQYRVHSYTRFRDKSTGTPSQFRLCGSATQGLQLQFTPYADIDIAIDRVMINYWQRLTWASDVIEFPIPQLEEYITLKCAARICKEANTKLSQKLAVMARDSYISVRAAVNLS